jgi:hypothetical protein
LHIAEFDHKKTAGLLQIEGSRRCRATTDGDGKRPPLHEPECEWASSPLPSPPEEERETTQRVGSVGSKRDIRSGDSLPDPLIQGRRGRKLAQREVGKVVIITAQ